MPSVPIPQQVPIERAGWNTDFSGNVQMPNNESTPVNPIMSGLSQAAQQAQTALQGAQTANTLNDVQMKQRQMALSMINAAASDPDPNQAQAKLASIVPIVNKFNPSFQIDPNIDVGTARTLAMGGIPTQEQPAFQMQQFLNPLKQQQISQSFGDQTGQGGAPEEGNTSTIDPRLKEGRAAALMGNKELADIDLQTYKADPNVLAQQKEQEKGGENLADAQKTFNVAFSNLPRAMERFQEVRNAAKDASSGLGTDSEGGGYGPKFAKTSLGQLVEPKVAAANQTIDQAISQGMMAELGPQLQGLKSNKYLDTIAGGATGLKRDDPADVKVKAVDGMQDQYIATLKSLAAQRRQYGDKNVPTDAQIDAAVAQNTPKTAAGQANAAFGNNRGTPAQNPDAALTAAGYSPEQIAQYKLIKSQGNK